MEKGVNLDYKDLISPSSKPQIIEYFYAWIHKNMLKQFALVLDASEKQKPQGDEKDHEDHLKDLACVCLK